MTPLHALPITAAIAGTVFAASEAAAQGFSSVEAINRCEDFIESALRPELGDDFRQPYKITCYFALIDPAIHGRHRDVCTRVSQALADPHRGISEFMCLGTYETYLREVPEESLLAEP